LFRQRFRVVPIVRCERSNRAWNRTRHPSVVKPVTCSPYLLLCLDSMLKSNGFHCLLARRVKTIGALRHIPGSVRVRSRRMFSHFPLFACSFLSLFLLIKTSKYSSHASCAVLTLMLV
jgi:hypothetical protein